MQQLTKDPNPNAPRHHDVVLVVTVPTYGKPSDDMKTAQAIKESLRTGVHSRTKVEIIDEDKGGGLVEVEDREYRRVGVERDGVQAEEEHE